MNFSPIIFQIYLADYLPQNRDELLRWTTGQSTFDWTAVLKMIATVEGSGWLQLKDMEEITKSKVKFLNFICKFQVRRVKCGRKVN